MKDWYNKANLIITVKGKDVQIMNQEREKLGSRLGFLLLSAGCAIGCGNVWKFPWMTGQYGGGFVLVYVLCLLLLGLPAARSGCITSWKSPARSGISTAIWHCSETWR